jgi:hypothetical protein
MKRRLSSRALKQVVNEITLGRLAGQERGRAKGIRELL